MKVRFGPDGRAQLLAALRYIRRDNPAAALAFRKKTEKVLRRLEDHPESGRKIPEFPDLPYREVIVVPYRFFYRTERDVAWVVAVWHGGQLPQEPR